MNPKVKSLPTEFADGVPSRTWFEWLHHYRLPAVVLGILAVCVLAIIYYQSTLVTGVELNARTWEIRQFSFRRDPFTNTQLTGVHHAPAKRSYVWDDQDIQLTSTIDAVIQTNLTLSQEIEDRWDLVNMISPKYSAGDAELLVRLLAASSPLNDIYWSDWSGNEPSKAAIFWPAAQNLVRFRLYSDLPSLFELALCESSDDEFETLIHDYLIRTFLRHCQSHVNESQLELARSMATIALKYGDHAELQRIADSVP